MCGADAVRVLAPRTCEGGGKSSAHWYRGEYEFPTAKRKNDLTVFTVLFLHFFVKDMRVMGSPRHQFENWWHPPRKRGGQGV